MLQETTLTLPSLYIVLSSFNRIRNLILINPVQDPNQTHQFQCVILQEYYSQGSYIEIFGIRSGCLHLLWAQRRIQSHRGCNCMVHANWLQPRAVFGHNFSVHRLAYATEIKSIQSHDSIEMASPWDSISYITLHYMYITLHYIT